MGLRPGPPIAALNAADVSKRFSFGSGGVRWLEALAVDPAPGALGFPDDAELQDRLARLKLRPRDAEEVINTLAIAERDPGTCWLLERAGHLLRGSMANASRKPEPPPTMPGWPELPPELRLLPVHLIVVSLDAIRRCHEEFGVPDDISWETLGYIGQAMSEYREKHGQAGIAISNWDWLRFSGYLYQAGRLQATLYWILTHPREAGPRFWYDDRTCADLGPGFRKGDPAIGLHVPPVDRLQPEACDRSLARFRDAFFRFGGAGPRIATCTSWLLDDQLAEYLPANSNIIAFQKRFELVPGGSDDDRGILSAVFGGDRRLELSELPQSNALQQAVVAHLRNGRHWRIRTGWLKLERIT